MQQRRRWVQNSVDLVDTTPLLEDINLHSLSVVEKTPELPTRLDSSTSSVVYHWTTHSGQKCQGRRGKKDSGQVSFPLVLVRESDGCGKSLAKAELW
jgi:hypothetical protein